MSAVERKSLFTVLAGAARKTASEIRVRISQALGYLEDRVHIVTIDNGKAFAEHKAIDAGLDADIYFAHPYASRERGTNENTNGLIRQHFPKSGDLTDVTDDEIQFVMDTLNRRPRKGLGFKAPFEAFFNVTTTLTEPVSRTTRIRDVRSRQSFFSRSSGRFPGRPG